MKLCGAWIALEYHISPAYALLRPVYSALRVECGCAIAPSSSHLDTLPPVDTATRLAPVCRATATTHSSETPWTDPKYQGIKWTIYRGVAYDITNFLDRHPGGQWLINLAVGRDATGGALCVSSDIANASHKARLRVGNPAC